jgi:hypothetical protein
LQALDNDPASVVVQGIGVGGTAGQGEDEKLAGYCFKKITVAQDQSFLIFFRGSHSLSIQKNWLMGRV